MTSATRTPAARTAAADDPGSATVSPAGEACYATKVS